MRLTVVIRQACEITFNVLRTGFLLSSFTHKEVYFVNTTGSHSHDGSTLCGVQSLLHGNKAHFYEMATRDLQ